MDIDVKSYVLNKDYKPEQMEYNEEIDGNLFPNRYEHLKKKEELREKYKNIKNSISRNKVRR